MTIKDGVKLTIFHKIIQTFIFAICLAGFLKQVRAQCCTTKDVRDNSTLQPVYVIYIGTSGIVQIPFDLEYTCQGNNGFSQCYPLPIIQVQDVSGVDMVPTTTYMSLQTDSTSVGSLNIDSNDANVVATGPTTVTILGIYGELDGKSDISAGFDIQFMEDPCNTAILDAYTVSDMTSNVFASLSQAVPVVNTDAEAANTSTGLDCGARKYVINSNDPSIDISPFLSIVTSPTHDIKLLSSDMAEINASPGYTILMTVSLVNFPHVVKSASFTVFITDPCPATTLQNTGVADMTDFSEDGVTTTQSVQLTDSVSLANDANGEGYLTCAPQSYQLDPSSTPAFVTISGNTISVDSTSRSADLAGSPYTVTLTSSILGGTLSIQETFQVTVVDWCTTTVITTVTPPTSMTEYVMDGAITTHDTSATNSVSVSQGDPDYCGSMQFTILDMPAGMSWSSLSSLGTQASQIQIFHEALSQLGTYSLRLEYALVSGFATPVEEPFTVTIMDVCALTKFQPTLVTDMTGLQLANTATNQQVLMIDDVSQALDPNAEGYIFCGARSYQLINAPTFVTLIGALVDTISVQSTLATDINSSPYTITLRSSLASGLGQQNYIDEVFKVTIVQCGINNITPSKSLGPYSYIFDDPEYSEVLPTYALVPDCNWQPTYSVVVSSPVYNIVDVSDNANLKHSTQDLSLVGDIFTLTINADFPDPNASQFSFTVQYTIVNPCPSTTFTQFGTCSDLSVTVNGPLAKATPVLQNWKDSESLNRYPNDGLTLCKGRSMSIDTAFTGQVWGSFTTSPLEYVVQSSSTSDPNGQEGTYTGYTCTVCLNAFPTICHTQTFDVTIGECVPNPHAQPTGSYADFTYTMFYDGAQTISKVAFDQAPCNFAETITCTIDNNPIPNTWISETATELKINTEDHTLHGTYTVRCTSDLGSSATNSQIATFTLTMIDPCLTSTFLPGFYVQADLSCPIKAPPVSNVWTDAQYQDKVNSEIGVLKGLGSADQSTCGTKEYIFHEVSELRHSKPTATSVQLAPTKNNEMGTYTCSVTIQFVNYGLTSTCSMTQTFACDVIPCAIVSITNTSPIPDTTYVIASPLLTLQLPIPHYVQTPSCGATATMTDLTPTLPAGMTFDPTADYQIQTNDVSQVGTTLITYRATFDDNSTFVVTLTFKISYTNPCADPTNTLNALTLTTMTTQILVGTPQTQDITTTDAASTTYGNQDGLTLCGARSYTITAGSGSWVSLVQTTAPNDTIQLLSNDLSHTPKTSSTTYPLSIDVCLQLYPTISCITYNLNLVVEPCKIVTFTADSSIPDTNYRILTDSTSPFLVNYPTFTQVPACQYTETYSSTVDTNALNAVQYPFLTQIDPTHYDVYEVQIANSGIYQVVLTSTLDDTYWQTGGGTANQDSSWKLALIDPCETTLVNQNLVDPSNEYTMLDMMTTVKDAAAPSIQTFVNFQDSISEKFGATFPPGDIQQGADICGPRQYTFTIDGGPSTSYAWFTFDISIGQIQIQTALDSDVKYGPGYQTTIQACLVRYPTQCSLVQTFEINIEECRLTAFGISVTQPDQEYIIFDTQKAYQLNAYVQTPLCGYTLSYDCNVQGLGSQAGINHNCKDIDITQVGKFITLDTLTDPTSEPVYKIETVDFTLHGQYTMTQTITIPGYRYTADNLDTLVDQWTQKVTDPCFVSAIEPQPGTFAADPLIETSVKLGTDGMLPYLDSNVGTESKFGWTHHGDTASTTYTPLGSASVCRDRNYAVSIVDWQYENGGPIVAYNPPANGDTFIYLDIQLPELNVHTNLDQFIGYYTIKLDVWLMYYPAISHVQFFKVRIWPCLVNTFVQDVPLTTANPFIFKLYQPAVTLYFTPYTQTPLCGYEYTYDLSLSNGDPLPSFAQITNCPNGLPCSISFFSNSRFDDKCDYGVDHDLDPSTPNQNMDTCFTGNENPYPFLLTATLAPSPTSTYFHPDQASTLTQNTQGSFNVWPKDICMAADLVAFDPNTKQETSAIYNFVYSPLTLEYEFETTQDSVSLDTVNNIVDGSGHDMCGPRAYYTQSSAGSVISFATVHETAEPPKIMVQTSFWQFRGLQQAVFQTQLIWYPHLIVNRLFLISLYGLEETLPAEKQYHKITGLATIWQFLPFTMTPNDGRWAIGYSLEYKRIFESDNQWQPAPTWITLDPLTLEVKVKTGNFNFEGDWNVRVIGFVVDYPDNMAFGEPILLTLGKDDPPVEITNQPYFTKKLTESVTKSWDVFNEAGWKYQLPEYADDDDGETVSLVILTKPDFVTFDEKKRLFRIESGQIEQIDVGEYAISLRLVDSSQTASDDYVISISVTEKLKEFGWEWKKLAKSYPRPKPRIKKIYPNGLVQVEWDRPMRKPRQYKTLKNETCEWINPETLLSETKPAIEVSIVSGAFSQGSNLEFKWEIQLWQESNFEIKLDFEDPLIISTLGDPEHVKVIFYCEELFLDKYHNMPVKGGPDMNQDSVLYKILPLQVETLSEEEKVALATAQSNAQTFGLVNFLINIAFSASLNQLWSMINTQQIIVLIPLFKVQVPLNATQFLNLIMTVAAFDIIPTDDLYASLFGLTEIEAPDALNSNFDTVGFETTWSFFNLGSLGIVILILPLLISIDMTLRICALFQFETAARWQKQIAKKLYWNALIRFVIESYTILTVCCLINITALTWNTGGEIFMSSFALVGTVFVTTFPFASSLFLYKNWEKIKNGDEDFEHKYGSLSEGLNTQKGKQVIWYQNLFLLRRLAMGWAVVFMSELLFFQLSQLIMFVIFATIIVGQYTPLQTKKDNNSEYFNEVMIMVTTYAFICFSEWGPDEQLIRYRLGYVAIFAVAFHIFYNMMVIFAQTIHLQNLKLRRWILMRKFAKTRSEKIYKMQKKIRHAKFKQQRDERREIMKEKDKFIADRYMKANVLRFGNFQTRDLTRAPKPEGQDYSDRQSKSRMPNVPPPLNLRPMLKVQAIKDDKSQKFAWNCDKDIVLPKPKRKNLLIQTTNASIYDHRNNNSSNDSASNSDSSSNKSSSSSNNSEGISNGEQNLKQESQSKSTKDDKTSTQISKNPSNDTEKHSQKNQEQSQKLLITEELRDLTDYLNNQKRVAISDRSIPDKLEEKKVPKDLLDDSFFDQEILHDVNRQISMEQHTTEEVNGSVGNRTQVRFDGQEDDGQFDNQTELQRTRQFVRERSFDRINKSCDDDSGQANNSVENDGQRDMQDMLMILSDMEFSINGEADQ